MIYALIAASIVIVVLAAFVIYLLHCPYDAFKGF